MPHRAFPFVLAALLALASPARAQQQILPGLYEDELIEALVADYSPTSVLSEAASKDTLYAVIERVTAGEQDGTVGLYSGLFIPFDCDPVCDPSQDVFNDGTGLNQEHVWPRSLGAGSGLAERDMHHLFPSRVTVNSSRGNLPFGESPDDETTTWYYLDQQQSSPPAGNPDLWSELLSGVLLEPREDKKGDVARALFYFYTMYGPAGTGQADDAFFEEMKEMLLAWHETDLPTKEEIARSERVATYQATGSGLAAINPFVHDATLARRAFFGTVLYVRQGADLDPALQTGASWVSAFGDLQIGLAAAATDVLRFSVGEVWVAEGTYYPTDNDDRFISFEPALALYGGFSGTEATLEERDWEAHPTELSGDIGVPGDYSDNSNFVVSVPGGKSTLIDGFLITGARQMTDGSTPFHRGAGIRANLGGSSFDSLTVRRCSIERNAGSGVVLFRTDARLEDVSFELNETGIRAARSDVTVERGVWHRNQTGASFRAGVARLQDAHFNGNGQALAADLYNGGASVTVQDAVFEHHGPFDIPPVGSVQARSVVGAFESSVSIVNARFEGNEVYETTAPISVDGSEVELTNVTFVGNYGGRAGAIAATGQEVTARFTNVVATANSGSEAGSVLVEDYVHDVRVRNSILWGNGEADGVPEYVASGFETEVVFAHTVVDGGCQPNEYVSCDSVLDADPLFMMLPGTGDDGEWGTDDDEYGDLRLQEGSPAVDFGLTAFLPADAFDLDGDGDTTEPIPFDLDGGERVQGSAVDLGPYESPFAVSSGAGAEDVADRLAAPYPNPSAGHVRVPITLGAPRAAVTVEVLDVLGRRVAVLHNGPLAAGEHAVTLERRPLPAGVYVVRVSAGDLVRTQRFTLVR